MSTKNLIRYAGATKETPKNQQPKRIPAAVRADELFGLGMSTTQIAKTMNVSEHRVLKLINIGRSARLGVQSPYSSREVR